VVTLAFERNGTWGEEAARYIEKVGGGNLVKEHERTAAVWRLVARLSMALQRGNAHILDVMTRQWAKETGVVISPAAAV